MNKNILIILIIGILLLGGYMVMSDKSQVKTGSEKQLQKETQQEKEEDADEAAESEDKDQEEEATRVLVTETGFEPQTVTVKAGTKVRWVNKTKATANVSSSLHPTHEDYPPLNLGDFEPEKRVSLVFTEAGTYKYHDHLNPTKFGTVVVE